MTLRSGASGIDTSSTGTQKQGFKVAQLRELILIRDVQFRGLDPRLLVQHPPSSLICVTATGDLGKSHTGLLIQPITVTDQR
ncbi:MAG: hypothetical protein SFY66_17350 [Oculatellaceae cyanobacterium bins.114]|nr:hypothetical protein [Oculatellaceae cyanobacterium bins.114]